MRADEDGKRDEELGIGRQPQQRDDASVSNGTSP